MKKIAPPKRTRQTDSELRTEYKLDYGKSRLNRFASRYREGALAVVLDPDVALVFRSSDTVNALLRSVISALPKQTRKQKSDAKHN